MEKNRRSDRQGGAAARVAFVPGEDVLLLSLALPPMPGAQRRAAVAFAVEDCIARPLDEVHVILGPQVPVPPGNWLVAVIARDALAAHLTRLQPGPGVRVLPDTLSLPVPRPGTWAASEADGRVILRMADGTGMVVSVGALPTLHRLAGSPGIVLHGGVLPDDLPHVPAATGQVADLPAGPDLRQASDTGGPTGLYRFLIRAAAVVAAAALAQLVLLGAEVVVLSQRLAASEVVVRAALSQVGLSMDGDVEATLSRAIRERRGGGGPPGFLPLLAAAVAAMAPLSGQASLRDLRYGRDSGEIAITVQAADLGTLQAVETALSAAAFRVVAGTATIADGLAEQHLTVAR